MTREINWARDHELWWRDAISIQGNTLVEHTHDPSSIDGTIINAYANTVDIDNPTVLNKRVKISFDIEKEKGYFARGESIFCLIDNLPYVVISSPSLFARTRNPIPAGRYQRGTSRGFDRYAIPVSKVVRNFNVIAGRVLLHNSTGQRHIYGNSTCIFSTTADMKSFNWGYDSVSAFLRKTPLESLAFVENRLQEVRDMTGKGRVHVVADTASYSCVHAPVGDKFNTVINITNEELGKYNISFITGEIREGHVT